MNRPLVLVTVPVQMFSHIASRGNWTESKLTTSGVAEELGYSNMPSRLDRLLRIKSTGQ
jgi:hypothetical protein